jgi:hypothetical protein
MKLFDVSNSESNHSLQCTVPRLLNLKYAVTYDYNEDAMRSFEITNSREEQGAPLVKSVTSWLRHLTC